LPAPRHLSPLSLHDALPIFCLDARSGHQPTPAPVSRTRPAGPSLIARSGTSAISPGLAPTKRSRIRLRFVFRTQAKPPQVQPHVDRKSTRLNSSHVKISYAV